jgi:hypothetical protein
MCHLLTITRAPDYRIAYAENQQSFPNVTKLENELRKDALLEYQERWSRSPMLNSNWRYCCCPCICPLFLLLGMFTAVFKYFGCCAPKSFAVQPNMVVYESDDTVVYSDAILKNGPDTNETKIVHIGQHKPTKAELSVM